MKRLSSTEVFEKAASREWTVEEATDYLMESREIEQSRETWERIVFICAFAGAVFICFNILKLIVWLVK